MNDFKILYGDLEKVWSIKEYERERSPLLSQYQHLDLPLIELDLQFPQLNDRSKQPDKTYLWSSDPQQNQLLWQASARCCQPTSTCLNINGKPLANSPFLNQTVARLEGFQIKERVKTSVEETSTSDSSQETTSSSLSQKIFLRAREDLDLTLQAAKVAIASQESFGNFGDRIKSKETPTEEQTDFHPNENEADSFGFKTKKSSSSDRQDWF